MSEKIYRQDKIKELISKLEISSQEELNKQLLKNGIEITQATLSRDLRELKVSKLPNSKGNYIYQLTETDVVEIKTDNELLAFTHNLAVIRTKPGFATRIALEIDARPNSEILGTIAGDDTLFVALKENFNKDLVQNTIKNFIPNIKIKS